MATWVVVKIMVPFWVLSIIVLGDPKGDHRFENHPYTPEWTQRLSAHEPGVEINNIFELTVTGSCYNR